MKFENTFNAGNVMQIIGAFIAILLAWADLKYDVISMKSQTDKNTIAISNIQDKDLYEIRKVQVSLAENMAVLTAIVKERTKGNF